MRPVASVLRLLAGVCLLFAGWGTFCQAAPAQTPSAMGAEASASEQAARIQLGRRLFYDADLSGDGSMACASCHEQRHAFADGMPTHAGITDEAGVRNVPSLGNVGAFKTLTWLDQHITTLEQQVSTPVFEHGPVEMGMPDWPTLLHRVSGDACYQKLFAQAFKAENGRIDSRTVPEALAAFERTLISRESLWDKAQQKKADLPEGAQRGAALFFGSARCASCHTGDVFSDQSFYVITPNHPARVRTPSLRNVGVTAPYLHDGSAPTLNAAIQAHTHSPAFSPMDEKALEAFLQTLTDQSFLHNPALALPPESCPV
nr:cytochrome c peroxidase [uncultured Acetobacter sp.]